PDDGPVELRSHDLDVLADYLDLDDASLVDQLVRFAQVTPAEARELRRQLARRPVLASVAGLLAGSLATFGVGASAVGDRPVAAAPAAVVAAAPEPAASTIATTTVWSPPPAEAVATTPATTPVATPVTTALLPPTTPPSTGARPPNAVPRPTTTTTAPPDTAIAAAAAITNPDEPVPFSTAP
ncbi:MAG: hypothetical protein QOC92_1419, partial [Acidimicrobiaceae bacterium]